MQCKYCVALPMAGNDFPPSAAVLECHQAFGNGLDDLFVNFVGAEVAFDEDDAIGFAPGDLTVFLPNAAEEFALFLLKAVFVLAGFSGRALIAAARAGEACVE